MFFNLIALTCLESLLILPAANPWISADWGDKEPQYAPGSLFWMTNQYKQCPVVYRAMLEIDDKPIDSAVFLMKGLDYAYVFLNGRQVGSKSKKEEAANPISLDGYIAHAIKPGKNVIAVSTTSSGFSMLVYIKYKDGKVKYFSSDLKNWKVQKFPPLTMLEFEDFMKPDFEADGWFPVKETSEEPLKVSDSEMENVSKQITEEHLRKLDNDAKWRLNMLINKGISIVEWEAYGWGGPERLPDWVKQKAIQALAKENPPGWLHNAAEALTMYVYLEDMVTNLKNHGIGLKALGISDDDIKVFEESSEILGTTLVQMKEKIARDNYFDGLHLALKGKESINKVRSKRIVNDLCSCLDNKFGWFDTNSLLENDIRGWGLEFGSSVKVFSSPLSPGAYISANEDKVVLQGWDRLEPIKVYNKPANVGPVCIWAVIGNKVKNLKPNPEGIVYDRSRDGELDENWITLIHDLSAGGNLPIELVFITKPEKILFKTGEKGINEVTIHFKNPGGRFFILRPLKEWRGMLQQAQTLKSDPVNENAARQYINEFRLWSRALLNYPVTFSQAFIPDPQNKYAILCADVYNYWELEDDWNTKPLKIAPLPPLATYGLMMGYPGLEVISKTQNLGSRGLWGDHIAAVDQDYVVYRVPLEPIKRFGGFTSYCFGGTDIGEPGSITEIETIKRTGSNTFRPQHNQTGERAIKTLEWCWERGIQNVFNTDEKWVPDICEHFRILAQKCKDYPPDAVAYDLLNEPETREPKPYDALMRKITGAIREFDKTHLIYVEVFPPWGPSASPFPQAAFENLKPTGDQLTCYSFHDYEYRLPPRWPNEEHDIRSLLNRWIPAFKYSIDHRQPIHLGEFGGFEQTEENVYENPCGFTMMMDHFKIFDQFGWHWHYYSNRGTVRVRKDGSLQDSYVQEAHRKYFSKGTFNVNRVWE